MSVISCIQEHRDDIIAVHGITGIYGGLFGLARGMVCAEDYQRDSFFMKKTPNTGIFIAKSFWKGAWKGLIFPELCIFYSFRALFSKSI
jgi:hypothetical protein